MEQRPIQPLFLSPPLSHPEALDCIIQSCTSERDLERERWDCCVFHIVYIISFGPEIPLMTHPWLFQQSRKGSDHLFFPFPDSTPPKKPEMMSRKFRAICNNSNFMAILYIQNNAGRCCCCSFCGGATVKWNSTYYVITLTRSSIQERYWEIWKSLIK